MKVQHRTSIFSKPQSMLLLEMIWNFGKNIFSYKFRKKIERYKSGSAIKNRVLKPRLIVESEYDKKHC